MSRSGRPIGKVAELLGVMSAETVRQGVRRAEVDVGAGPGITSEESAEVKCRRRGNAELKLRGSCLPTPPDTHPTPRVPAPTGSRQRNGPACSRYATTVRFP